MEVDEGIEGVHGDRREGTVSLMPVLVPFLGLAEVGKVWKLSLA